MSDNPLVSIVVLNWNGFDDTKQCINSIRNLNYKNTEIIVVDNGSTDGSKEFLKSQQGIVFIDLDKNYGFTGGHIRGEEAARGKYLAIINNDLVLDEYWLDEALQTFKRHKKAAVVGGKNFKWNDDNPAFNKSNGFTSWQKVDPYTGYTRTLLIGEQECQVDSISGAALLIDRKRLGKVGYFDNDFFAYYEETDLIARLKRAGYEAYFNPAAMAWHKVAASSQGGAESYFYLYMMHRNRYMFAVKNLDKKYLKVFQRNYRREFLLALTARLFQPNNENRARVKAYFWNLKHKRVTLGKRKAVMKLGDSYVKHLGAEIPKGVTVIVPCYNYGNYLPEAIGSLLKQTLKPLKIIIINDGSTDNTETVLRRYANNKLVEIINKPNSGVIDTKNLGLQKSTTYWTIFFDADDVLGVDYIKKTVQTALQKRLDVVYTDMKLFGAGSAVFHAGAFSLGRLVRKNFIHNSALISTSLLKQVGGYKPEMKDGLEDWELYLSLAEAGARFGYVPEPIFKYRQHDQALSRNARVVKKEKALYNLLISMHPGLRKYRSRLRRWSITLIKGGFNFIVHPSLWLVLLRTLPKAGFAFVETLVHELRLRKAKLYKE